MIALRSELACQTTFPFKAASRNFRCLDTLDWYRFNERNSGETGLYGISNITTLLIRSIGEVNVLIALETGNTRIYKSVLQKLQHLSINMHVWLI